MRNILLMIVSTETSDSIEKTKHASFQTVFFCMPIEPRNRLSLLIIKSIKLERKTIRTTGIRSINYLLEDIRHTHQRIEIANIEDTRPNA